MNSTRLQTLVVIFCQYADCKYLKHYHYSGHTIVLNKLTINIKFENMSMNFKKNINQSLFVSNNLYDSVE